MRSSGAHVYTMCAQPNFPKCFRCYKPNNHKVYGVICITPYNKLLLVKGAKTGKWSFPKGHKEGSETYLACALRETIEETGVDLKDILPVAYHRLSVGEYFFFEIQEELPLAIQDDTEILEAKWVSLHDLNNMNCNVDVNNFLDRVNRRLRG